MEDSAERALATPRGWWWFIVLGRQCISMGPKQFLITLPRQKQLTVMKFHAWNVGVDITFLSNIISLRPRHPLLLECACIVRKHSSQRIQTIWKQGSHSPAPSCNAQVRNSINKRYERCKWSVNASMHCFVLKRLLSSPAHKEHISTTNNVEQLDCSLHSHILSHSQMSAFTAP